jgi:hypothetical protein
MLADLSGCFSFYARIRSLIHPPMVVIIRIATRRAIRICTYAMAAMACQQAVRENEFPLFRLRPGP